MTADMFLTLAAMSDLSERIKKAKLTDVFPSDWRLTAVYDHDDGLFVKVQFVYSFEIAVNVPPPSDHTEGAFNKCVEDAYEEIKERWENDFGVLEDAGYTTADEKYSALRGVSNYRAPYINNMQDNLEDGLAWWHFVRDLTQPDVISVGDEYYLNGVRLKVVDIDKP